MVRKQLYIDDEQDTRLKGHARMLGKTESEIVREALDRFLNEQQREVREAAISELWKLSHDRQVAGALPGARDWTRDDLHDRRLHRDR